MRYGTKTRTTTFYYLICKECGVEGPSRTEKEEAVHAALGLGWGLDWREQHAYCPEHSREVEA